MTQQKYPTTVLEDIVREQARQKALWGDQSDNSPDRWTTILTEEVGEVAKAVLEPEPVMALYTELVQVAAVAASWAEIVARPLIEEREREKRASPNYPNGVGGARIPCPGCTEDPGFCGNHAAPCFTCGGSGKVRA